MAISGFLQDGGAAWRYCGTPVKGSPDAWLFKDAGRKAPGKASSICVLLHLCSTAVPGTRNDTTLMRN